MDLDITKVITQVVVIVVALVLLRVSRSVLESGKYKKLLKKHIEAVKNLQCYARIEQTHCELHKFHVGRSLKTTTRKEVTTIYGIKLSSNAHLESYTKSLLELNKELERLETIPGQLKLLASAFKS